jgi:hypothetical protein
MAMDTNLYWFVHSIFNSPHTSSICQPFFGTVTNGNNHYVFYQIDESCMCYNVLYKVFHTFRAKV